MITRNKFTTVPGITGSLATTVPGITGWLVSELLLLHLLRLS